MPEFRQSSFGAGELSPSLYGADHLPQYASGARTARNFLPSKYRTLVNRPGTIYLHEVKDSTKLTRLIPFNFSSGQSYAIEAGDLNFRITKNDGTQVVAQGLIALDFGAGRAKSSDKGATWGTPAAPPYSTFYCACEAASGRFIAGGYNGTTAGVVAYTDDLGATWTGVTVPVGNAAVYAIAYNGRRIVACSTTTFAFSDDNGATWTASTPPAGFGTVSSIAWGNGRWIVVGFSAGSLARYSFSYDGESWSAPTAVGDLDSSYTQSYLIGVCFCAGQFLAVGKTILPTAKALVCQIGVLGSNWKWSVLGAGESLEAVATNGTIGVAVGAAAGGAAPVAYKFDSVTAAWSSIAGAPAGKPFKAITFSRNYFVMVGGDGVGGHCSRWDGTAWTADPTFAVGQWNCIAPGKGTETLELTTPYSSSIVREIMTAQVGDILTLLRTRQAPQEIRRYGEHDWRLDAWYKTPPTLKVTGLAFSPSANQTEDQTHVTQPWEVVVTWEDEQTGRESLASAALVAGGSGKFLVYPDKPQTYVWNVIEKARRYWIYRGQNNEWGLIGSAKQPVIAAGSSPTTVSFTDKGQVPLYTENPPTWDNPFQSDLSYPACACYLDDRLVVAGTLVQPALVKGSRTSDYYNFDEPLIPSDASAWEFNLATRRFEEALWMVPLEALVVGTSEGEWVLTGQGGGPITGESVLARSKAQRPCARIQPVVVGNGIVYVQAGGQVVRYFKPSRDVLSEADPAVWGGVELSAFSQHLLEGYSIVDMAYAQSPDSTIWIVRSDGALLSLTFIPEHGVWGFARHDSGGDVFEAVTVIPDGTRDVPFFVVKRTINGATKRYVEMLATRAPASVSVGVFLDCAKTQTIASGNTVTGLSHLEARTVGVLADGTYRGTYTVAAGSVTFTGPAATTVTAGLTITADFESLDFPQGRARQKRVARVALEYRLNPSFSDASPVPTGVTAAGVALGQDSSNLSDVRKLSDARDGLLEVPIDSAYNPGGRCFLRHTQPFPLEIRGITREVNT